MLNSLQQLTSGWLPWKHRISSAMHWTKLMFKGALVQEGSEKKLIAFGYSTITAPRRAFAEAEERGKKNCKVL